MCPMNTLRRHAGGLSCPSLEHTHTHTHSPPPPPPPFPTPPEFSHPDYRLYALCQHLQNYTKVPKNLYIHSLTQYRCITKKILLYAYLLQVQESQQKAWWDEFLSEFFQESATLVIEVDFGEGTRKYRKCLCSQLLAYHLHL